VALAASVHAAQEVRIRIDPGRTLGRVNPLIFGNNQLGYDLVHRAIEAIDPKAQLGILTTSSSAADCLRWTEEVLRAIATRPPFAIEHTYRPGYRANTGQPGADVLARIEHRRPSGDGSFPAAVFSYGV